MFMCVVIIISIIMISIISVVRINVICVVDKCFTKCIICIIRIMVIVIIIVTIGISAMANIITRSKSQIIITYSRVISIISYIYN